MSKENNALLKPKATRIALSKIRTDEETYQPRSGGLRPDHVAALTKPIEQGNDLDRIHLKKEVDGVYIVLNGHHSFAAYRKAGRKGVIPAYVYECTVAEGQIIAIRENAKKRLQMDNDERLNWAWKLTCEQRQISKSSVAKECGVGPATVGRMRTVLKELEEKNEELPIGWWDARELNKGSRKEWTDEEREERLEAAKEHLHERIGRELWQVAKRDPEAAMEVVHKIFGDYRFSRGCDHLGYISPKDMECFSDLDEPSEWA